MHDLIPYKTIFAAKAGEEDSLSAIVRHYSSYITSFSKRPFYDEYGNKYEVVNEEIRSQIENRLMLQIVCKFDPYKLPEGECIEIV